MKAAAVSITANRETGTASQIQREIGGRGGRGGAQPKGLGGTLASDVFTFVVSLVVVGGAILAVVAIAQSGEEQPATPWPLRRRASRPSVRVHRPPRRRRRARPVPALQAAVTMPLSAPTVAAPPRPARPVSPTGQVVWSPGPVTAAEPAPQPVERVRRLRSTAALVLLLALVGVVLAVLVGTGLFVLNAVLRHAASSGALAALAS